MEGGHQTGGQKKGTEGRHGGEVVTCSDKLRRPGKCVCVLEGHKLLGNTVNKQEEVTEQLLDSVLENLKMLFLISSPPPILFL